MTVAEAIGYAALVLNIWGQLATHPQGHGRLAYPAGGK